MGIKVSLEHRTTYRFDRSVGIGPHIVRLRPAPHTRTPIESYSLTVSPADHFVNWQQDPFGNYLARLVFPTKARELEVTVGLVADMGVINPFDFFIEEYAESFPFRYPPALGADLEPYLAPVEDTPGAGLGPALTDWLAGITVADEISTIDFLVQLNTKIYSDVAYSVRMEPGVQTPDQTLTRAIGSCRDSAWLLVAALRDFGLAARFVSGYLVQLASDTESLDGPSGPTEDFTDLHAWAEVFIPGAGWVGLDPTSALFAGEGHIPLAATPHPAHAAPIAGQTDPCEVTFDFANTVTRVHEDPRVTKPYTPQQVGHLHELGREVDRRLVAQGIQLTMGGEPTFVSVDDMTSAEWTVAADGPHKRELANRLSGALAERFASGGLVQRSQGKWYPGEPLPRWQIGLHWRTDREPLWRDPALCADPFDRGQALPDAEAQAKAYAEAVVAAFGLPASQCIPCYEDPLSVLAGELSRPEGPRADEPDPGTELVAALDATEQPVAWALPLIPAWWGDGWASPAWRTRRGRLVLIPGDSPAGQRLPLSAVGWKDPEYAGEESVHARLADGLPDAVLSAVVVDPDESPGRTALVVQARDGFVHVFLPPLEKLEQFCQLARLLERAAANTATPVILEGYAPPNDPRLRTLMVTPDPGVIEVNLQPTSSWDELAEVTTELYDRARRNRLGTETFAVDGRHSGTGGGNHITLGGAEPKTSPMLRRPELLTSMVGYWQHHPSLSYLFSGRFIGPTSQAPRVDEGRPETLYELEIAFAEIAKLPDTDHRPWIVDRALRHLLTDITGNTHRAEFCIDKLYSPDSMRGRLGLVELRGFEMPPHPEMALVQALLVRALLLRFAEDPFSAPLVRWGTALHERFLLPYYCAADAAAMVADLRAHDIGFDLSWLDPYLEFRFPRIGAVHVDNVLLELRTAIEPWHVLGEEASAGGTARYVDSSTERVQIRVVGLVPGRHLVTCNGVAVPLQPTGTPGEYVAGVRFRAWKPWSALHPTLEIDSPLTFELIDVGAAVSLGGATYHVVHPGGRSYDHPPVNAKEAEARRARRFEAMGHTTGVIDIDALGSQAAWRRYGGDDYPLTLDLRRRLPRGWGRS
ncbi:transglutaminase family protein [Microlunatus ginsengisoli]|uniref:Transglutaminase family protein n=1 Tax=Microlunatus ginsengisoli TaxID=363863 RepID=A0ABP6ZHW4_9ACTN